MVFKIIINDVEYISSTNYSISQQAGNVSTTTLDILVNEGQPIPTSLMFVQILDEDDTPFFAGIIESVTSPNFSTTFEAKRYNLQVLSLEAIFNRRLVSEAFIDMTTTEIIQFLFDNYIAEENITLGFISEFDQNYENYNCSFTKLSEVLGELAEDVNASFYISADKKFYFVDRTQFNQVAIPESITSIQYSEDAGELRNIQVITGASEETSRQTESYTYNEDETTRNLKYQISQVVGVTINGTPAGVGIRGVNDDDDDITFLWEFGFNSVSVNRNATVQPENNDLIAIVYYGFYDIIITKINGQSVSEVAEISDTSGKIEAVFTDETLQSYNDAELKADSLLNNFNRRESELSCICNDIAKSDLYNEWTFDYPELNISGNYVITERTITDWGEGVLIRLKLKNKNFFQKYGVVLRKETKKIGKEIKVYKSSTLFDELNIIDNISVNIGDLAGFPGESGLLPELANIEMNTFYPV